MNLLNRIHKTKVYVKVKANGTKDKLKFVITAIICLTIIEAIALMNGINGTLLRFVVITIAALVGLVIPTPKILRR